MSVGKILTVGRQLLTWVTACSRSWQQYALTVRSPYFLVVTLHPCCKVAALGNPRELSSSDGRRKGEKTIFFSFSVEVVPMAKPGPGDLTWKSMQVPAKSPCHRSIALPSECWVQWVTRPSGRVILKELWEHAQLDLDCVKFTFAGVCLLLNSFVWSLPPNHCW